MKSLKQHISAAFSNPAFLSLIRISGAGAGFLAQLTLAWSLPADQLGIFYSATSLVAVAAIFTSQGYPQIAARFVTRYQAKDRPRLLSFFVGRSMSDGLTLALAATVVIIGGVMMYPGLSDSARWSFIICATTLPAATLLNVQTNLAAAMKYFGICYLPEGIVKPVLFFVVLVALGLLGFKYTSVEAALIISFVTFGVAAYVTRAMKPLLPRWKFQPLRADPVARRWRREAWPLIVLSLFTNFFTDVAILCATPFLPSSEIAIFGFCLKLALLVGYVVQIAQTMVVPDLAIARNRGATNEVYRLLGRAIKMPSIATGFATIGVALFGHHLLALLGPHFVSGHAALTLLVASQFVRSLAGPSVHVITLTGSQFVNASLSAGAVGVLMLGYWLLTPAFDLTGAAMAVLIAYTIWLAAMALTLHRLGEFQTDVLTWMMRTARIGSPKPLRSATALPKVG